MAAFARGFPGWPDRRPVGPWYLNGPGAARISAGCAKPRLPCTGWKTQIATLARLLVRASHHCSLWNALSGAPGYARHCLACFVFSVLSVSVATGLPSVVSRVIAA